MFNIGPGEIIAIAVVALLLFGRRVPEVMRNLGKGVSEFKKGLREIEDNVDRSGEETATKKLQGQGEKEPKG